jgi:hypothetical protein
LFGAGGRVTEDTFWSLIARLDWRKRDRRAAVRPLIQALTELPAADIREFDEILAEKLYALDTVAHARNIGTGAYKGRGDVFSADGFLYARLMAVAKGRAFYERALADPRQMPKDEDFEDLLSAGWKSFEAKTGQEYDRLTRFGFESFSNREGWAGAE